MPIWIVEIFKSNYRTFIDNPILFLLAFIAGAFLGYLFSKLIHKGKIEGLEERIKLKAEQIEVKDQTIQSMSADRAKLEQAAEQPSGKQWSSASPVPVEVRRTESNSKFAAANARIVHATEDRLRDLLLNGRFTFVFNPATGGNKPLTFLPNGDIGEGRNHQENRWRIADGRLEILHQDGGVYSRFILLSDGQSLHHTNDPDTRSLLGQYIKRNAGTGR